ncbi:alkylation response protein AidB-like acyl-CoA dehydrogenase [Nocardiopsis mwathae]|uniref:Alkylation response protein AidB-like acyl-CoA dehydrogenase n=1 Tax=Nocardiopsis mwathae TaxID=1472723 RepID=A0A7X0D8A1_9ACTN|nr:acyl-CoA dehydrogenase family protein [Nocardiopsis mwathae]MBB6174546.1 alkylation response protein AidB-like acyl-CoA dehydrogenase [Nocardiopsis mwathae]
MTIITDEQPGAAAPARWTTRPTTPEGWLRRASEVRAVLAADAAERDRANATPYTEVALLKESGLVTMMGPVEHGGGGQEWPTALKVVREVSAADGSIGHLLGYHYTWNYVPRFIGTPEQSERFEADCARNGWFLAGAVNARDADVVVRDEGDTLVFNGRKNFATGSRVSDVTCIEGVLEGTDTHVFAMVPSTDPGVVPLGGWDNMGQRLTESGGIAFENVRAPWSDALGFTDKTFTPRPYGTVQIPTGQLLMGAFWLGMARGALDAAVAYTHTHGKAWGGYERTVDEPSVADTIGDLTAKLWAAEALMDEVALENVEIHRAPDALTERRRGEHKIRAAAVKVRADEVALEVTSRIFEVTRARSTASKYGFDRFWRNVRTHTLHDPVAYQRRELGRYRLFDEVPEPGWYS